MKCSIIGCPGEYESRRVVHRARRGDRTIVIEEVPAEECGWMFTQGSSGGPEQPWATVINAVGVGMPELRGLVPAYGLAES